MMKTQTIILLGAGAVVLYILYNNWNSVQTVIKQATSPGGAPVDPAVLNGQGGIPNLINPNTGSRFFYGS